MARKKAFFREDTKAGIKKKIPVEVSSVHGIEALNPEQFTIIGPLVPRGFSSARKFMKHGKEVKPRRVYTIEQALRLRNTPVQLREEAFNHIAGEDYGGYSFVPLRGDMRKRKVSLLECLEGARLFAYSHQVPGTGIKVKPYSDSRRVIQDGAEVVVNLPSRTQGESRLQLKLTSVPVVDGQEKQVVSLGLGSDHSCGAKRFNIRYKYSDSKEGSGILNICAHEVASYLATIEHFWNNEKNMIPLQMSQIAIPSQETVDFYLRLGNNVLVRDGDLKIRDKLRKMNRAEKEIALWNFVKIYGHDRTFYSKASRDGDVGDYSWDK